MVVTGIAPAETVVRPRTASRDRNDLERSRAGFSRSHIILDLSREALSELGHEVHSSARTQDPPLFVYDGTGDFVYEEAARHYEDVQKRAAFKIAAEQKRIEESITRSQPVRDAAPIPSTVTFDGMLGAGF